MEEKLNALAVIFIMIMTTELQAVKMQSACHNAIYDPFF